MYIYCGCVCVCVFILYHGSLSMWQELRDKIWALDLVCCLSTLTSVIQFIRNIHKTKKVLKIFMPLKTQ